jgi:hypothetical protein
MAEERVEVALPDLARWLVIAAVVLVGIGLYAVYGRTTEPVVMPVVVEAER